MSERIIRQLIDDLDHTEISDGKGGSVEFSLRGTSYSIDLTDANIAKLDKALAPFVAAAAKASGSPASASRSSSSSSGRKKLGGRRTSTRASANTSATIRAWATENGHEVSARGRIPSSVSEAYDQSHQRSK